MKWIALAVAAIASASCAPSAAAPTIGIATSDASSPSATPSPAATTAAPAVSGRLTAVAFADLAHGWLGTADGILGTSDGGATWTAQLAGTPIHQIWTFDPTRAWALAGDRFEIYRTDDGRSWRPLPPTDPPIVDLQFVTRSVGWAIAMPRRSASSGEQQAGTLLASTDGGAIWRPIADRAISSICFVNEREGWGADGKRVFKTSDGGRTWSQLVDLPVADKGPWFPTIRCAGSANARVQITEPYAALSHAPYLVFRTSDAGRTWLLEYREGYTLGSTTPQGTSGLGSYPSLFGTFADGRTWFVTCSPPTDTQTYLVLRAGGDVDIRATIPATGCVAAASFVDALHGWILKFEYRPDRTLVVLSRTDDGGQTWTRPTVP